MIQCTMFTPTRSQMMVTAPELSPTWILMRAASLRLATPASLSLVKLEICPANGAHVKNYPDVRLRKFLTTLDNLSSISNLTCNSFTDKYLSLNPASPAYIGNRSIVLHYANKTRIACANIVVGKKANSSSNGNSSGTSTTSSGSSPSGTSTSSGSGSRTSGSSTSVPSAPGSGAVPSVQLSSVSFCALFGFLALAMM
jgi:uncharacterized membrane protein YgcG